MSGASGAREEAQELFPLDFRKTAAHARLDGAGLQLKFLQCAGALARKVQSMPATILGVATPDEPAECLESIHEADDAGLVDIQRGGNLHLGNTGLGCTVRQDAKLSLADASFGHFAQATPLQCQLYTPQAEAQRLARQAALWTRRG